MRWNKIKSLKVKVKITETNLLGKKFEIIIGQNEHKPIIIVGIEN